jgi:hypothetical protein
VQQQQLDAGDGSPAVERAHDESVSDPITDRNAHAGAHAHARADADIRTDADSGRHADSSAYADPETDGDSHRHPDAGSFAHPEADADCDTGRDNRLRLESCDRQRHGLPAVGQHVHAKLADYRAQHSGGHGVLGKPTLRLG